MQTLLFYLGVAVLLAHELDAMSQAEWQLLFILRKQPNASARSLFVLIHIPLTVMLLWITHHKALSIQQWARHGIMLFLVIHMALHKRLESHHSYTFHSPLSKGLIYGCGMIGGVYCIIELFEQLLLLSL